MKMCKTGINVGCQISSKTAQLLGVRFPGTSLQDLLIRPSTFRNLKSATALWPVPNYIRLGNKETSSYTKRPPKLLSNPRSFEYHSNVDPMSCHKDNITSICWSVSLWSGRNVHWPRRMLPLVSHGECRRDKRTDGRQTVTLRFLLDAASETTAYKCVNIFISVSTRC